MTMMDANTEPNLKSGDVHTAKQPDVESPKMLPKSGSAKTRVRKTSRLHFLKKILDKYVMACMSATSNGSLQGLSSHEVAVLQASDSVLSRSVSQKDDDVFSPEFLALAARTSRQSSLSDPSTRLVQGVPMVDFHLMSSSSSRRPSVDTVHELELYEERVTHSDTELAQLYKTRSMRPTGQFRSPSRRIASADNVHDGPLVRAMSAGSYGRSPPRFSNLDGYGQFPPRSSKYHERYVQTPGKMSRDVSAPKTSADLYRSRSQKPPRMPRFFTSSSTKSVRVVDFDDVLSRSNSKKSTRENPYSNYDTRKQADVDS